MTKGTIVLVPFPFTDLSGHKVRPCLVLYVEEYGEDCIIAFISSVKSERLGRRDVKISSTKQNGLKVDSIIKVDKIATLQKKIFLGAIGQIEPKVLKSVDSVLKNMFL